MRVKTEARRDAIIQEAIQLFREVGYERASMNELAKRLGGSKATLYGYFESKELLFVAVTEVLGKTHLDLALKELTEGTNDNLAETLHRFGVSMVQLINKPDALGVYRMVVGEAGHSDVAKLFFEIGPQRAIKSVAQFLQGAINSGAIRPCEPEIAARHFMALITAESEDNLFKRTVPKLTKTKASHMVRRAVEVFLHGYQL